jgi:hypothetical protein
MGVCTAYYLLSAPDPPRVTLVEAHALGQGASGRASGFMALDWHGPTTTSLAELSWRLHADLATAHDGAGVWGYRAVDSISYAMQASSAASTPATEHTEAPRLTRRESSSEIPPVSLNGELDQTWLNVEGEINLLGTMDTTALVYVPFAVEPPIDVDDERKNTVRLREGHLRNRPLQRFDLCSWPSRPSEHVIRWPSAVPPHPAPR